MVLKVIGFHVQASLAFPYGKQNSKKYQEIPESHLLLLDDIFRGAMWRLPTRQYFITQHKIIQNSGISCKMVTIYIG